MFQDHFPLYLMYHVHLKSPSSKTYYTQTWPYANIHNALSYVQYARLCQVQIRLPTLALKPGGYITRSPKQEYQ